MPLSPMLKALVRKLRFSQANLAPWSGRQAILLGIRPEAITDPEGADRKSGNIQPFDQPRRGHRTRRARTRS